jgi:hypothetical protein
MATIFKMLRIQYALSHQDEKDRQDIFLMGLREAERDNKETKKLLSPRVPKQSHKKDESNNTSLEYLKNEAHETSQESITDSTINVGVHNSSTNDQKKHLIKGVTNKEGFTILGVDKNCM